VERQGNVVSVGTPEQAQRFVRGELSRYAAISRRIGLEAQ
jgi:hypothetical protein